MIRLALRSVWRSRRRNLLLIVALAIGVAGTTFGDSFLHGWVRSILIDARLNIPGTAQIVRRGYFDDPSLAMAFRIDRDVLERISAGQPFVTRLTSSAIVSSERATRGINLVGIDPDAERPLTMVGRLELRGRLPASVDDGLAIGAELAARLKTDVGRRVVIRLRDAGGEMRERGIRIIGVYTSPDGGIESHVAWMGLERMRRFAGAPGAVTDIALFDVDLARAEPLLPEGLVIMDWRDIQPLLAGISDLMASAGWFLRAVIFIALAFGIVNSLMASVFERSHEFGLLLALGMRPRRIFEQIAWEVTCIALVALAVGGGVGRLVAELFSSGFELTAYQGLGLPGLWGTIYLDWRWQDFMSLALFVLVLALVASVYPVRYAMQLDPAVALKRA